MSKTTTSINNTPIRIIVAILTIMIGAGVLGASPVSASGSSISAEEFERICKELGGSYWKGADGSAVCELPGDTHCVFDAQTQTMFCVLIHDDTDTPARTHVEGDPRSADPISTGSVISTGADTGVGGIARTTRR